ncbi:MAG: NADH:ubiquinone reductase (Na(+)-transporting) subunit C [Yoonia sp.]
MSRNSPLALWRRFLALPNDSRTKTLGVAFLVSLVAAIAVSTTSVALKPRQEAQVQAAREANLAEMVATLPGLAEVMRETGAESLETVVVALETGQIDPTLDAATYDFLNAQSDPTLSQPLAAFEDTAKIGQRPNFAPVYILRGTQGLALVVLPVYGTGYQSTIRAYLALHGDLTTIAALSIYEQGETPGLGTRITDPSWQALWSGKQATDDAGEVTITVVRGTANTATEVDGITGATRSTTGVTNLVQFWLGDLGYGTFLEALKAEEF